MYLELLVNNRDIIADFPGARNSNLISVNETFVGFSSFIWNEK